MSKAIYEIIKDGRNEYYFLLRNSKGVVIAKSNTPSPTKQACKNVIEDVKKSANAEIEEDE